MIQAISYQPIFFARHLHLLIVCMMIDMVFFFLIDDVLPLLLYKHVLFIFCKDHLSVCLLRNYHSDWFEIILRPKLRCYTYWCITYFALFINLKTSCFFEFNQHRQVFGWKVHHDPKHYNVGDVLFEYLGSSCSKHWVCLEVAAPRRFSMMFRSIYSN